MLNCLVRLMPSIHDYLSGSIDKTIHACHRSAHRLSYAWISRSILELLDLITRTLGSILFRSLFLSIHIAFTRRNSWPRIRVCINAMIAHVDPVVQWKVIWVCDDSKWLYSQRQSLSGWPCTRGAILLPYCHTSLNSINLPVRCKSFNNNKSIHRQVDYQICRLKKYRRNPQKAQASIIYNLVINRA